MDGENSRLGTGQKQMMKKKLLSRHQFYGDELTGLREWAIGSEWSGKKLWDVNQL